MGIFGDLWDGAKSLGGGAIGLGTLGLLGGEDSLARIPVLGALTGSKTDAQKALLEKQQQLAEEARRKSEQMTQARMNALGQSLLAFNPRNQMMAEMFGPQAAFTPQQFAQMAQNPIPEQQAWGQGTDQERIGQVKRRDAERQRQQMIQQGIQPLPGRPPPVQMQGPQAARRFR